MKYYYLYSTNNGGAIYHWFCDSNLQNIYYRSVATSNVFKLREKSFTGDRVYDIRIINGLSLNNTDIVFRDNVLSVEGALNFANNKILNSI